MVKGGVKSMILHYQSLLVFYLLTEYRFVCNYEQKKKRFCVIIAKKKFKPHRDSRVIWKRFFFFADAAITATTTTITITITTTAQ